MPLMHQFLLDKADWYEACLARLAQALGYGYIPPSVALLLRHMTVGTPARIALLAQRIGVTRRRISQIAAEGVKLGVLELIEDADDKRVLLVQLSPGGTQMANGAVASMHRIEAELARRIGRSKLDSLTELLAMDWGPAEVQPEPPARATTGTSTTRSPRKAAAAKTAKSAKTANRRTAAARKEA
jgi:DNA-binding MarR family transcriptional regulator